MRFVRALLLAAAALGAASCESTGDPPVAQWGREPLDPPAGRYETLDRGGGQGGLALGGRGRGGRAQMIPGTGRFVGSGRTRQFDNDAAEGEGVTLNLVNVPIAQAAKIVLGDIAGADFVVDPKLDGKVTVHTAHAVKKSAAIELFQSALRVSGAAVVDSGGLYKIVPLDQAATSGGSISSGAAGRSSRQIGQQIGDGARVVQLRYVSASEMKRLLDPISEKGGVVRADDARNTLTLSGSAQEVATLEDAISMFDIDTMRGMSFALVPVKSSDPDALAEDLRKVFGSEREGPMNGMIRFIGNKHLSAILAISPQAQYLSRARAWIERLDQRAAGNEKQFYSYRVQNRPAKELVQVLSAMFGGGSGKGGNVSPRFGQSSMSSDAAPQGGYGSSGAPGPLGALSASGPTGASGGPGSGDGGAGGSGGLGGAGGMSSGGLGSGGMGSGGLGSGGGFGGGGGFGAGMGGSQSASQASGGAQEVSLGEDSRYKLAVDEAKNALVVMATPDDYKRMLRIIETLDVLPNQVFIEATIAEVSLTDQLHFGVRWFFMQNRSATGFSDAAGPFATPTPIGGVIPSGGAANPFNLGGGFRPNSVAGENILGAAVGGLFPGFAYALRAPSAQVTLNALNEITKVNIISTPSLTVLDNRQAILQVGDQVPVQTLNTVSAVGTQNSTTYRDTGVILRITPHINESGRVMLELEQEVSNVRPGTAGANNTPTIQQRRVKTQVVVNDSESLMLGGLIQDSHSGGAGQVPVIGDLPILGNVFKDKSDSIDKTELLIMITPHVVRTLTEAREITDEYKRKLLQISTKAKVRPHSIEQSTRRVLLDDWSVSGSMQDRVSR